MGRGPKSKRGGGGEGRAAGRRRERDREEETTDNSLLRNLRGRWRPQYSDWPVWAFPSTGPRHDGILL